LINVTAAAARWDCSRVPHSCSILLFTLPCTPIAAAAAGIKHLHVLPFISQFCLMVHDLEVALVEGTTAAAAVAAAPQQQQKQQQLEGAAEQGQQSPEEAAAADAARSVRAGGQDEQQM
jgi:hypothetical protein